MENTIFYRCPHCGNIAIKAIDSGADLVCCGKAMQPLEVHTTEIGTEKHLPVVARGCSIASQECSLTVRVGSSEHPMTEDHFIQFIALETTGGIQITRLTATDKPTTRFCCGKSKPIAVYEYCNIHGLWKTTVR